MINVNRSETAVAIFISLCGFVAGRIMTEPLDELRPYEYQNKIYGLAKKSMVRIPMMLSIVLFLCRKEKATIYSIIHQIAWYILVIRSGYAYINSPLAGVELLKSIMIPFMVLWFAVGSIAYIFLKIDDTKNINLNPKHKPKPKKKRKK